MQHCIGVANDGREVRLLSPHLLTNTARVLKAAGVNDAEAGEMWQMPGESIMLRDLARRGARLEGRYGDVFSPPDVTGKDLTEVVERLLDLPAD
jgi:hypothetical protein